MKPRIVSLFILAALLAACGASSTAPAPTNAPAAPTSAPVQPTIAPIAATSVAAQPTAAPVEPTVAPAEPTSVPAGPAVLETTDEYRLIRHATGETKIPAALKCIVVAGSGYIDHLLALDVKLMRRRPWPRRQRLPRAPGGPTRRREICGWHARGQPETVALLNPDVIIAMHPDHTSGDFATNFDPIAPTIYLLDPWRDWRTALVEMGVGRSRKNRPRPSSPSSTASWPRSRRS